MKFGSDPSVRILAWVCLCFAAVGCASSGQRPQVASSTKPATDPADVQLVGDLARPWGMNSIRTEGVSLVVGLAGTGSDAPPSPERSMLISEMQTREVDQPDEVLAAPTTALVLVQALLPPGVQEGDRIDLEVRVPRRSETQSLQGGWLMQTRLKEYAVLNQRLASGHVTGVGQGEVLVDSQLLGEDDPVLLTRGRILGGGVASKSRSLGLTVRDHSLSVKTSARIGEAINRRFHVYDGGSKRGVAIPKRDSFIELKVHPRYRQNIIRYMRVIQSIPVRASQADLAVLLEALREEQRRPETSSKAAVRLEAVGKEAIPTLREGMQAEDAEVRFYAAEALAYLNVADAAAELAAAVRHEPAFRVRGFQALGAMDDISAQEALTELLHVPSAETRYGAFRTLRQLSPQDPLVSGESMQGHFHYHVISTTGPPLVHVSRTTRPEIVVFGTDQQLQHPVMIFAGNDIVLRSTDTGQLIISRFSANDADQRRIISTSLDDVIRTIVELEGSYPDIVQAITSAKRNGSLTCRVEFSALPRSGRIYQRGQGGPAEVGDGDEDGEGERGGSDPTEAVEFTAGDHAPSASVGTESTTVELDAQHDPNIIFETE